MHAGTAPVTAAHSAAHKFFQAFRSLYIYPKTRFQPSVTVDPENRGSEKAGMLSDPSLTNELELETNELYRKNKFGVVRDMRT